MRHPALKQNKAVPCVKTKDSVCKEETQNKFCWIQYLEANVQPYATLGSEMN